MSKIKIIKTLKKMMAHERSARTIGNIAEADLYADKIAELRAKHNITQEIRLDAETEARAFDDYDGEQVFTADSKLFQKRRVAWEETLFAALCNYFDCRPVVFLHHNLKIVVGERDNRAKVIESYLHCTAKAIESYDEFILPERKRLTLKAKRLLRKSFLLGFNFGVISRLEKYTAVLKRLSAFKENYDIEPQRTQSALVRRESIEISEKREEINRTLDAIEENAAEVKPKQIEVDPVAFHIGMSSGASCSLTEAVELSAAQTSEDLRECENLYREKMNRESSGFSYCYPIVTQGTLFGVFD